MSSEIVEDPPSRLNSSLAAGGEIALDMEDKLKAISSSCEDVDEDPSREVRRRKGKGKGKGIARPCRASPPADQDGSTGVVRCTSNASQKKVSGLGRPKLGLLGKSSSREDPFVDDCDIPEDFRKENCNFFLTMAQLVSLIFILAALGCSLWIPSLRAYGVVCDLHLWDWELMLLVLVCGHLFSGWVVRISLYFIERNFFLRKRLLYFVYKVRKAVQNWLWLGLVLLIWHTVFDKKVETATGSTNLNYVAKLLLCLLITAAIRLFKILLIKFLASSFYVSVYFDRIQKSLFNQYIIHTLSGPPNNMEEDGGKAASDIKLPAPGKNGRVTSISIDRLHKLDQRNVSAWNMAQFVRIIRYGTLSTLDEELGDAAAMQIRSEHEAKNAAKKIFTNLAQPGSIYIYLEDMMRFMREDEALKLITLFEGASRVSKKCLKNWVVNVFRERKHLALTLNDMKTAINRLHQMVNVIVGMIIISIWLLVLKIANPQFFVVVAGFQLLLFFIFGGTLKTIFQSIIFLFVTHPFDVGDQCEVNGVQMVVEEMNILSTIFLRFDHQKIMCPNSKLATLFIGKSPSIV